MLNDTFIQNKGITKTLIHENGKNSVNEIGWAADYDGQKANISLGFNNNGQIGQYQFQLTNQDLEELLTIPSVDESLEKRLLRDFKKKESSDRKPRKEPLIIVLENPVPRIKVSSGLNKTRHSKRYTHLSSPLPKEKLVLSVKKKTPRHNTTKKRNSSRKASKKTVRFLDF
jgi:hypothetical protein